MLNSIKGRQCTICLNKVKTNIGFCQTYVYCTLHKLLPFAFCVKIRIPLDNLPHLEYSCQGMMVVSEVACLFKLKAPKKEVRKFVEFLHFHLSVTVIDQIWANPWTVFMNKSFAMPAAGTKSIVKCINLSFNGSCTGSKQWTKMIT